MNHIPSIATNLYSEYRFGFNGQEKDDEVTGQSGSHLNFKFRMYDSRIGRFFAVDPLTKKYPELTPFQFASDNPIWMREIEGLEGLEYSKYNNKKNDEFFIKMKLNSGEIGLKAQVSELKVGGSYNLGGNDLEIKLFTGTQNGRFDLGISHTHRSIEEGSYSIYYGPFGGTEGRQKETVRKLNILNGATKHEDQDFNSYESFSYENVSVTDDSKTVSVDAKVSILIIGVELEVGFESTPQKNKIGNGLSPRKNNNEVRKHKE